MFTLLFIAFLIADVVLRLWLGLRQIRHVHQHRNQVPAAFADRISLRSHQRAADYTHGKVQVGIFETIVEAGVLIGLTMLGGLQALDLYMGRQFDNEMWRQLALIGSVVLIMGLVSVPFSLWRKFRLEARFGFNRMSFGLFVGDTLKGLVVAILLGLPLTAGVLWIMGHAGANWQWWAWGVWVAFNLLVLWLFPTVIAPLFNRFTPLDNPELAQRIQALATRCGFAIKGLFVMDGSKRSAHGNAYFTGFGRSRRIVFYDTLLSRLNADEVEAVLAHELGHFHHRHILKRMVLSFIMALVFLQVLAWLSHQVWFYTELGVIPQLGRPNDALALILFFLVVPVFTFWVTPVMNLLSRKDEYQADQFAATQASSAALVAALVKLYDDNAATLTPDPMHSAFHDSHPPATLRVERLVLHGR